MQSLGAERLPRIANTQQGKIIMSITMTVSQDITVNGIVFGMRAKTVHKGEVVVDTLFHSPLADTPSIGGTRFVESGVVEELAHLSYAMTLKCAICGIPATGQKTLVTAPPETTSSTHEKARILAEHIEAVRRFRPCGIWGPDMNCPEAVMDGVALAGFGRNVCGLSERHGGLSIDDNGFTAVGIDESIAWLGARHGIKPATASVQGFGAVGAGVARMLWDRGIATVAISNALGCAVNNKGLDIGALLEARRFGGDEHVLHVASRLPGSQVYLLNPNRLFECATDLLVPAARTTAIVAGGELENAVRENPQALSVQEVIRWTGCCVIAEGANHPISDRATTYAEDMGVIVLPDFVINGGGLIGCWLDWEARNITGAVLSVRDATTRVRGCIRAACEEVELAPRMKNRAIELARGRNRSGARRSCSVGARGTCVATAS
jgi:glutamate dehydrogenase (NADP+)